MLREGRAALPLGAASANLSKSLFTVNELPMVGLFDADCDLPSQFCQSEFPQLFCFLWNRIAKPFRGVDPQTNRIQGIAQRGRVRVAVRGTSREVRHFGDERLVFVAP